MKWIYLVFIYFFMMFSLRAHELTLQITDVHVKLINIRYSDGTPFSNENCEIYFKDKDLNVLIQSVQTDKQGNILFLPETSGVYLIQCFSKSGHGIKEELEFNSTYKPTIESHYLVYFKYIVSIITIFLILLIIIKFKQK